MKKIKHKIKKKGHVVEKKEFDTVNYLQRNQKLVIAGIVIIFLIVICAGSFYTWSKNQNIDANVVLSTAVTAQGYEKVIQKYPYADIRPVAMLDLAVALFWEGQYNEAITAYKKFIAKYPEHQLVPNAVLGVGYCYQELGQNEQAKDQFAKVCQNYPGTLWAQEAVERNK